MKLKYFVFQLRSRAFLSRKHSLLKDEDNHFFILSISLKAYAAGARNSFTDNSKKYPPGQHYRQGDDLELDDDLKAVTVC